ncbi:50S ribosomal protein L24 [Candidatus Saccharibacteria bacterium]|nr:MAG: 50S ribosomal protein L24 [Candidatus Saccharibacteria bacterium]
MAANQPGTMKIKKGDLVKVQTGAHKGETGKVLSVLPKQSAVLIDGIGVVKRHIKPNQLNPRGGTKDVHIPMNISKVALVVDDKTSATSRVGYATTKDGAKVRVARALKNKEIK